MIFFAKCTFVFCGGRTNITRFFFVLFCFYVLRTYGTKFAWEDGHAWETRIVGKIQFTIFLRLIMTRVLLYFAIHISWLLELLSYTGVTPDWWKSYWCFVAGEWESDLRMASWGLLEWYDRLLPHYESFSFCIVLSLQTRKFNKSFDFLKYSAIAISDRFDVALFYPVLYVSMKVESWITADLRRH